MIDKAAELIMPVKEQATTSVLTTSGNDHTSRPFEDCEDEDDDGDALIAWSQGLCLADFRKSSEAGDTLAAALASVQL